MMKYSNKNGGFVIGLVVLAIAAASVLGIIAVEKKMSPLKVEKVQDNMVGSGGRTVTASSVGVADLTGLGTDVATALAVNIGSAGAPVVQNGALGTPSSGVVTNLTGTASVNINGTVGATTPSTGVFTNATTTNATSTVSNIDTLKVTGTVGIGTSTPTQMLSVAGTVLANNYQATSTTEVSSFVGVKAGTKVNTDGATITVDWLQGPTQEVVLGATGRTLAFSNVQPGAALKLWVWQDGTGSRTITTYPTGTHWAGGSAPTLTATANKFDILVFTTASSTTQFSAGASLNY